MSQNKLKQKKIKENEVKEDLYKNVQNTNKTANRICQGPLARSLKTKEQLENLEM